MGFQDAISGGSLGFDSPWMSPKDHGGGQEEVPLEIKVASRPGNSGQGIAVSSGAWHPTQSSLVEPQGGGAIIGGGIGGGPVSSGSWYPNHRGFIGGSGTRTGGYG